MNQLELLQNLGHTKQAKLLGTAIGDMNGSKYEWWSIIHSAQRMRHGVNDTKTYIREAHTGNVLA